VAEEAQEDEDGGVEEEDGDDSESDSDDDDIKLVFTGGPQRTLDLRWVPGMRYGLTQTGGRNSRRPTSLASANGPTLRSARHRQLPTLLLTNLLLPRSVSQHTLLELT
jgi:hypothetical protein